MKLQRSIPIADLSYRVLGQRPEEANPADACSAVAHYLLHNRPALAAAVQVEPGPGKVVLKASGLAAGEMLREAEELLLSAAAPADGDEIAVDPEEFAVEVDDFAPQEVGAEREILRSRARYFPYPECQWYEVTTGELTLSERAIAFDPELVITTDEEANADGGHETALEDVLDVYRGEWWDIPCLMVATEAVTRRYGWPAERSEPELEFDVDEWLTQLRRLSEGGQ